MQDGSTARGEEYNTETNSVLRCDCELTNGMKWKVNRKLNSTSSHWFLDTTPTVLVGFISLAN